LTIEKKIKSQSLSFDTKGNNSFTSRSSEPNFHFKSFPKRKQQFKELNLIKLLKKYTGKDSFSRE
jgi:hypothetical protein